MADRAGWSIGKNRRFRAHPLLRTVDPSYLDKVPFAGSTPKQAEAIEHNEEGGADVGGDGGPEGGEAEEGGGGDEELEAEREGDVLADRSESTARVADEPGEAVEVVGHQGDVGGLDRGIGASSAHCDAEGGTSHRGGVVDAVAVTWGGCLLRL